MQAFGRVLLLTSMSCEGIEEPTTLCPAISVISGGLPTIGLTTESLLALCIAKSLKHLHGTVTRDILLKFEGFPSTFRGIFLGIPRMCDRLHNILRRLLCDDDRVAHAMMGYWVS